MEHELHCATGHMSTFHATGSQGKMDDSIFQLPETHTLSPPTSHPLTLTSPPVTHLFC